MLTFLEVNGAATEASAIESEMPETIKFPTTKNIGRKYPGKANLPAWAVFNAPQSLQPSPHMMTCRLHFKSKFMSKHKILILIHIKI